MDLLRLPTSHLNDGFLLANPQSLRLSSLSLVSFSLPSISHRTQIRTLFVCARRKRKRAGNPRLTRFLFNSLSLLSSNLHIIPPPLDLVIADLGGVDGRGGGGGGGGGLGFWKGWGRFDRWRRKRNKVPFFIFVCLLLWICGFCRITGKEIKSDEVLKALGICLFGVAMLKQLKREAVSLVFGLLCFIAVLGFGFKEDTLSKLASRVGSGSSVLFRKKRSRRRV